MSPRARPDISQLSLPNLRRNAYLNKPARISPLHERQITPQCTNHPAAAVAIDTDAEEAAYPDWALGRGWTTSQITVHLPNFQYTSLNTISFYCKLLSSTNSGTLWNTVFGFIDLKKKATDFSCGLHFHTSRNHSCYLTLWTASQERAGRHVPWVFGYSLVSKKHKGVYYVN